VINCLTVAVRLELFSRSVIDSGESANSCVTQLVAFEMSCSELCVGRLSVDSYKSNCRPTCPEGGGAGKCPSGELAARGKCPFTVSY